MVTRCISNSRSSTGQPVRPQAEGSVSLVVQNIIKLRSQSLFSSTSLKQSVTEESRVSLSIPPVISVLRISINEETEEPRLGKVKFKFSSILKGHFKKTEFINESVFKRTFSGWGYSSVVQLLPSTHKFLESNAQRERGPPSTRWNNQWLCILVIYYNYQMMTSHHQS